MFEFIGKIDARDLEEAYVGEALIVKSNLQVIPHASVDNISGCEEGVSIVAGGSIVQSLNNVLLARCNVTLSVL
jgi:hypothetical protein